MKRFICIAIIATSLNATASETVQKIVGTATKTKDQSFFYTETDEIHIVDDHITKIDSIYKDKDNKLMVEMHSDFSKKPYLPDILFVDHRRNVQSKTEYIDSEKVVAISQNFKDPKETKSKKLAYRDDMINSMGLINDIRENIASLKKEKKSYRYVIPALMDDYGMVLRYRENDDKKDDATVKFAFNLESFFIRNLSGVKESILAFDEKGRFIKAFNGISNILDDNQKTVEVAIKYTAP